MHFQLFATDKQLEEFKNKDQPGGPPPPAGVPPPHPNVRAHLHTLWVVFFLVWDHNW